LGVLTGFVVGDLDLSITGQIFHLFLTTPKPITADLASPETYYEAKFTQI
jgi:hypothetical protein